MIDSPMIDASYNSVEQVEVEAQPGLAKLLKEGTMESHKAAEDTHFVREFLKGNISRKAYCHFVANLCHIYEVMEEELDNHCHNALIAPIYFPKELRRTPGLRADAEFFEIDANPTPGAMAYGSRLREVAASSPELLVAHAYVRYMGDLSGGRFLKRAATSGLQLPADGSGTAFYTFTHIPLKDSKKFKNMYRAQLDSLNVHKGQEAALVAEANHAFDLNLHMLLELDALAGLAAERSPLQPDAPLDCVACGGCPFAMFFGPNAKIPEGHPKLPETEAPTKLGRACVMENVQLSGKKTPGERRCPLACFGSAAPGFAAVILSISAGIGKKMWMDLLDAVVDITLRMAPRPESKSPLAHIGGSVVLTAGILPLVCGVARERLGLSFW